MKKILLTLAAAATLAAVAAPVAAQPRNGNGNGNGNGDRSYEAQRDNAEREWDNDRRRGGGGGDYRLHTPYVDSLEWKINDAAQRRVITGQQARQLMAEFRQVQPIAWRVQTGQASAWETQRLARAVDRIDRAVDDRRNAQRYGDQGYGQQGNNPRAWR